MGSLAWPPADESGSATDRHRSLYRRPRNPVKGLQLKPRPGSCRDAHHRLTEDAPAYLEHRQPRESWFPNRLATGPKLAAGDSPFARGRMLMGTDRRRIRQQMLEVGVEVQDLENALPYTFLAPTVVALKNRVPFAQPIRKISPRCPGFRLPDDRIDEPPVAIAKSSWIALLTRQIRGYQSPLIVGQFMSSIHRVPPQNSRLEEHVITFPEK